MLLFCTLSAQVAVGCRLHAEARSLLRVGALGDPTMCTINQVMTVAMATGPWHGTDLASLFCQISLFLFNNSVRCACLSNFNQFAVAATRPNFAQGTIYPTVRCMRYSGVEPLTLTSTPTSTSTPTPNNREWLVWCRTPNPKPNPEQP